VATIGSTLLSPFTEWYTMPAGIGTFVLEVPNELGRLTPFAA
jgi:hypothetical protein